MADAARKASFSPVFIKRLFSDAFQTGLPDLYLKREIAVLRYAHAHTHTHTHAMLTLTLTLTLTPCTHSRKFYWSIPRPSHLIQHSTCLSISLYFQHAFKTSSRLIHQLLCQISSDVSNDLCAWLTKASA